MKKTIFYIFSFLFIMQKDTFADSINILGAEEASVNACYTASGGTAHYTYSISGGSINPATGCIISLPSCAPAQPAKATITAKDNSGNTGTKDVRLPNGAWVMTDYAGINSGRPVQIYTSGTYRKRWTFSCNARQWTQPEQQPYGIGSGDLRTDDPVWGMTDRHCPLPQYTGLTTLQYFNNCPGTSCYPYAGNKNCTVPSGCSGQGDQGTTYYWYISYIGYINSEYRCPCTKTSNTETCGDGIDNNCNGEIDENCAQCMDNDKDGYKAYDARTCPQGTDCNDNAPLINPATIWYKDADNDKYSDGATLTQCERPNGYKLAKDLIATSGDCDDSSETGNDVYPGAAEKCDGKDNNCNGKKDEGCKKILHYISGKGQEGLICETIKEPFRVAVLDDNGSPQGGIGINWQITNAPALDAQITQMTTKTGSDGGASAYLKLGSSPGTHTVDSTCPECTEGSPQTFTATAKCPEVTAYYQGGNSPWADEPYDNWCKYTDTSKSPSVTINKTCQYDDKGNLLSGYTQFGIADKGCALTSMSMVMARYGYGNSASPAEWNEFLNQINGYRDGEVRWDVPTIVNSQLTTDLYKKSENTNKPLSNSVIDNYLAKCMPVIIKVKNWRQKKDGTWTWSWHWIVVTEKSGGNYNINDPGYTNRVNLSDPAYKNEIYGIQVYKKSTGGCQ